jgi:hypothetical protein
LITLLNNFIHRLHVSNILIHERFQAHSAVAYQLSALLPFYCNSSAFFAVKPAAEVYARCLPGGLRVLEIKFMRKKAFWQRQGPDERPNCVADVLRHATDLGTYPALAVLLRILPRYR